MIQVINKLTKTKLSSEEIVSFYESKRIFLKSFVTFRSGSRKKTSYWTAYTDGRSIDLNTGYDWLITSEENLNNKLTREQKDFLKKYRNGLTNKTLGIKGHCIHYLINNEMERAFDTLQFFFHVNDSYDDTKINIVIFEKGDTETLKKCRNANDKKQFMIQ